jgi:hypothetical protein
VYEAIVAPVDQRYSGQQCERLSFTIAHAYASTSLLCQWTIITDVNARKTLSYSLKARSSSSSAYLPPGCQLKWERALPEPPARFRSLSAACRYRPSASFSLESQWAYRSLEDGFPRALLSSEPSEAIGFPKDDVMQT